MRSTTFHHGPPADVREDGTTAETTERQPRSLLASPWFWGGGLVSLAVWAGIYAVFAR